VIELWDTSALILAARDPVIGADLAEALVADAVAITEPILLEYLNGARNPVEYDRFATALRAARVLETAPEAWRRALEVHRLLAVSGAGHQRSVRLVDLIVAAVAELHRVPVVHIDEDYERIAGFTRQATRRVGPAPAPHRRSLHGAFKDKVRRQPPDENWTALRDAAETTPDPDRSIS
jgi:predicted nucleic acid-binding protein